MNSQNENLTESRPTMETPGIVIQEPVTTRNNNTNDPPPDDEGDDKKKKGGNPRPWPKPKAYFGAKRIFSLLIAIDNYDMPGANLGGCVQDSLAVEK